MSTAAASPGHPTSIGPRELIVMIALLMSLNALCIDGMLPALDDIARELGAESGNQRSRSSGDDNQWSDWDYDKDIRESGVWRVGNLLGKQVRNSQGEVVAEFRGHSRTISGTLLAHGSDENSR